ncbi:MAG: DUF2946 domain-containing protein [Roseateles sp.]
MQSWRGLRKRLVWLVSCTMLLAALVPALSHLLLPRDAGVWTEICTLSGAKFVRLDLGSSNSTDEGGSSPDGTSSMERCPVCPLHQSGTALPPATLLHWLPDSRLAHALPLLFLSAPRPLFAWAPAQARAPPLQS